MVAPHEIGDLVRSLVRVPGSGFDYRTAGSQCLDLARASSLAASVPVPSTLPPALVTPTPPKRSTTTTTSAAVKLGSQDGVTAGILPRIESTTDVHANDTTVSEPSPNAAFSIPKRAKIVRMTREELSNNASRIVPLNTPAGPVLFLSAQPLSETSPPIHLDQLSLSELIKHRDELKRENEELRRRLILFRQLFKDKKRLKSVVKRLGIDVH